MWKDKKRDTQLRCRTCFKCPTCAPGTKHVLSDFIHGSKICNTCARTLTCVVCKKAKLKSEYPDTVWNNQKTQKHHRCRACFTCTRCPAGKVRRMVDFDFGMPYCKSCDTDTCSACQKTVEKDLCLTNRFSNVVLCLSCESRGCTLREPRLYRCDECGQRFGAQVYDSKQLWNFKLRQAIFKMRQSPG